MFPFRNNRLELLSVHLYMCLYTWLCPGVWYTYAYKSQRYHIHVYLGFMRNYNDDGDGDDDGIISLVIFTILVVAVAVGVVVVVIVDGAPNCQHVSGNNDSNNNKDAGNNHSRGGSETRATHKPNLCKFSLPLPFPPRSSTCHTHPCHSITPSPPVRASSAKETHSWIM